MRWTYCRCRRTPKLQRSCRARASWSTLPLTVSSLASSTQGRGDAEPNSKGWPGHSSSYLTPKQPKNAAPADGYYWRISNPGHSSRFLGTRFAWASRSGCVVRVGPQANGTSIFRHRTQTNWLGVWKPARSSLTMRLEQPCGTISWAGDARGGLRDTTPRVLQVAAFAAVRCRLGPGREPRRSVRGRGSTAPRKQDAQEREEHTHHGLL